MSDSQTRGSGFSSEAPLSAESPFLDTYRSTTAIEPPARPTVLVTFRNESPFLNELELEGQLGGPDPAAETIAEIRSDLYSGEFDIAVYELMGEASALIAERSPGEIGDPAAHAARMERVLADHYAPLQRSVNEMADKLAESLGPQDPLSLSEAELEEVLDRGMSQPTGLSPASELFLHEVKEKVKRAAKSGASAKKKKGQGGFLLKGVLKKIGKIVGTLLKKVLALATSKLPPQYKEVVEKLKARFLKKKSPPAGAKPANPAATPPADPATAEPAPSPAEPAGAQPATPPAPDGARPPSQPAAADVGEAQNELDVQLTELLLAEDETEQEAALAEYAAEEVAATDPLSDLDRARARFVREIGELRDGEDATPAVENFIPIIMQALKIGIRLIGRKRVVNFLGGLLGKLISPLTGKDLAPGLGKIIADIGLKVLLQTEVTPQLASEAAGQAVALTVEETVRSVAALPDHVLADEAVLEAYALEAFERAASANFPSSIVKPRLREAGDVNGVWVGLPVRGRRYYKKFSKQFDVVVTPQLASNVRTFGGTTLAAFFRDRLRLSGSEAVRVRVHLFEPMEGGRLHHIVQNERLRGPGGAGEAAWKHLHPLTTEAAAALLQHPGLGRPASHVLDPLRPMVGQRLYYLETELASTARTGDASHLHATLDFVRDEIKVCLYISEVIAQEIATMLRQRARPAVIVKRLREVYASEAGLLASVESYRLIRVVLDGNEHRPASSLADASRHALRRDLGRQLSGIVPDWLWSCLARFFAGPAADFVHATERPADGVKVAVTFHNPPGLQSLRAVFKGRQPTGVQEWPPRNVPNATVRVWPGSDRCSK